MKIIDNLRQYMSMVEGENILRRYFVMNGFDGALTAFGIILGSWIAGATDPTILIIAGMSASFAMGISGFWIAYLTERAERTKDQKKLEDAMVTDLKNTKIAKANFWVSLIIAFVDGMSPLIFSLIVIIPFLFVLGGGNMLIAYIVSTGLVLVEVTVLGLFLGAVSGKNKILYALKILPAAAVLAGLTFLLEVVVVGH
ncbi:MAG: VIT1/CCC1 transporter family protein [Candidatus Heimdallarchaeaceae archaeon]